VTEHLQTRAAGALALCLLATAVPARADDARAPARLIELPPEPPVPAGLTQVRLDVHTFKVVERFSGPVGYYKIVEDPAGAFIRAQYHPPLETVTLGIEVPEQLRQTTRRLRWRWRALVLPKGGNECQDGFGDSAAVVYVSWKRGLKWYSLKYVWSSLAPRGAVCDRRRNLFVVQDTVIRQSGGPLNTWLTEEIDPSFEFRKHFEDGDPNAEVPDFVGIGLMSDGDQTNSISSADYAGFSILR
jgi:hypothetical protein